MTGLGERLKEAREAKGYTLEDLQGITKIQKRYLTGIEKEDYRTMPGSFYVRAFIKQYAEAVGLDADEMLALYKDSSSAVEVVEEEERQMVTPKLSRRNSRSTGQLSKVMPKLIAALFIIVILLVIVFLWKHNPSRTPGVDGNLDKEIEVQDQKTPNVGLEKNPDEKKDDEKSDAQDKEEDADQEKEEEPEKEEQVLKHEQDSGENSSYSLTKASEFKLEIRTSADSWIGVLDAAQVERTSGARVMKKDEKIELDVSDTESVRIRVGRTAATEIYVNGELLKYATDAVTRNIIIEYKKEE